MAAPALAEGALPQARRVAARRRACRTAAAWLICLAGLAACAAPGPAPRPDDGPRSRTAYVVGNGWHTAIVMPRDKTAATGLLPEAADFPDAAYLEFGWGDRDYYPAAEKTLGMTLRAALVATPAVMHVAGRGRAPAADGSVETVRRLRLTEPGFRRLVAAIAGTFARPEAGKARPVSSGLDSAGRFYHARGRFHLFNTCNTWTARMLQAAGMPITPAGIVTADDLMQRLDAALASAGRRPAPGGAQRQADGAR